jgi:hypothetical protein
MGTVIELYQLVRERFPLISVSADRFREKRWGEYLDEGAECAWFESLADALNQEMQKEVPYKVHEPLFELIARVASNCSEPVHGCIEVSFVENLFWRVPSAKCEQYWKDLPPVLRRLYMEFHHREP